MAQFLDIWGGLYESSKNRQLHDSYCVGACKSLTEYRSSEFRYVMLLIFLHNGIFEFSKLNPAAEYDFFKKEGVCRRRSSQKG